jgi:DNA-binding CsgD family transcriptional regulator
VATLLARAGQAAELPCALASAEATRTAGPDPAAWAGAAGLAVERPFHAAYARWREAEALLSIGRRGEATEALRLAHALALQLGAVLLDAEVAALARRARLELDAEPALPVLARSPMARFGLTPREEEVLALVGDGLSNREIGERLFINVKTASVHVSNILAKLGVGSRVQAATLASRLRDESSRLEASTPA